VDIIGDGLDGWWYVGGTGLERATGIKVTPGKVSPPNQPYEWVAEIETVEGCRSTTGVQRQVVVTP